MQLSEQQKDILAWIHSRTTEIQEAVEPGSYAERQLEIWGVRWGVEADAAGRASISRSLRRLERRGLVLRQNRTGSPTGEVRRSKDEPHNTTTHVKLTEKGRKVVNKLKLSLC